MPSVFEVRIPTYRRPELLRRAIGSLLEQDYGHWRGLVIDDSPDREGEAVVSSFADSRIRYTANLRNQGILKNLAKAFSAAPLLEGTDFCCVLEDDNYYRPGFLSRAGSYLAKSDVSVFLSNAQIAQLFQDGREILQDRYTMSRFYGSTARIVPYEERLAKISNHRAVGNACLVWKLRSGIDFEIRQEPFNILVQETMRAVSTRLPFLYDPTPEVVWTDFADRPPKQRSFWAARWYYWRWRRSEIAMVRYCVTEMNRLKSQFQEPLDRDMVMASAGLLRKLGSVSHPYRLLLLKCSLLSLLVPHSEFSFSGGLSEKT